MSELEPWHGGSMLLSGAVGGEDGETDAFEGLVSALPEQHSSSIGNMRFILEAASDK